MLLGSMEQETEESGAKNSNIAVESNVDVTLPEVRLGMFGINERP